MDATITVICYKSKVLSNGESPLMLRVTKNRKRSMKSLGVSLNPDYWNFDKNEPKPECPNKSELEQLILKTKIEYQQKLLSAKINGENFTSETLVKESARKIKAQTVELFYTELIAKLKENGNVGNSYAYLNSYNSLKNFNKGKKLTFTFDMIDIQFLNKYEAWLRNNGNKEITVSYNFRTLRAAFNKAIENKIVDKNKNPFSDFKVSKFSTKTMKRALNKADILKILSYNTNDKTYYRKFAHDIFCFSYLCGGISFVDIANLKPDNIINERLTYHRQKTSTLINLPLTDTANNYINKYEDQCKDSLYLFPILDSNIHVTPVQKRDRVKKVLKHINRELKAIGNELKLKTELTSYVARHSFATVLKNSGVNIALISEALGHSELSTTQIYLDSFENKQFNEAMKLLI
ncbi:site-specific integrase [Maribellus sediminis]|uniref:site-specific integrase n=1 Tax=Maribellus sediminis TaxID=2696285 RepID=UPI0014322BE9|nr:site-specific integrase [Maribellus sediminis]